jgi:hypothetical protein
MLFLHSIRDTVVWEARETFKRPLGDPRAGYHKENSRIFCQDLKNEGQDIVEGSAPSETKEKTTNNRLRAMDIGALTTLGTVALTDR